MVINIPVDPNRALIGAVARTAEYGLSARSASNLRDGLVKVETHEGPSLRFDAGCWYGSPDNPLLIDVVIGGYIIGPQAPSGYIRLERTQ